MRAALRSCPSNRPKNSQVICLIFEILKTLFFQALKTFHAYYSDRLLGKKSRNETSQPPHVSMWVAGFRKAVKHQRLPRWPVTRFRRHKSRLATPAIPSKAAGAGSGVAIGATSAQVVPTRISPNDIVAPAFMAI